MAAPVTTTTVIRRTVTTHAIRVSGQNPMIHGPMLIVMNTVQAMLSEIPTIISFPPDNHAAAQPMSMASKKRPVKMPEFTQNG